MFKTMVVPVDGSDAAGKAVEVASTLAARDGARVVLLHVVTGDGKPCLPPVTRYSPETSA